ncbi:MAG: Nramp family divalent metal transporter [Deltaproteobacteria bacterium]|nr:Nramp family divalent metal transporter [Deltaproteobacteria bacterium]
MSIRLPDGVLPPPGRRALPPVPALRALLGPGIILAGLSIGSGEFVLWPRLTAQFGFAIFWAAWIGVTIQFFLNMEIERYTLATGESAVVGFLRLSRVFGPVFLLCGTLPWIWPGWATGAGTLLSWQIGGDPVVYAVAGLVLCGAVLSLGPVIYRTVEILQITLVSLIFAGLIYLFARLVTVDALLALGEGAIHIGHVPDGIELPLLLGALAFAGAGGTVNLAQSNYIRDKGYGMGIWVGRLTSPFTGREEAASDTGFVFDVDEESLPVWNLWWRRANIEHAISFYLLCVLSLALLCVITWSLLEPGAPVGEGFGFIREQANALSTRFGPGAEWTFLCAGIAVLVSTELALLDAVTRVVADVVHASLLRDSPRWTLSRLYIAILWGFIAFGVAVLLVGLDQPLTLLVLSSSLNAGVMFLYSGLLLWLNASSFSGPLRPSPARMAALVVALLFYGYFSALTLADQFG